MRATVATSHPPSVSAPAPLSYGGSGVDYGRIDPLKIAAQRAAAATASHLDAHGFSEVESSRGESAYVVDVGPFYLASIVECLGVEGARRRHDGRADRQGRLRGHRPGHDRDGGQRPDHRRRDAARRPGVLGRRRLRLVRRRRALRRARRRLEARLRPLRHRLGRRRNAGARRHRRSAAGSTSPPRAPASSAPRSGSRSAIASAPATRSSCWRRAASTPTASAWRASSPIGCRAAI